YFGTLRSGVLSTALAATFLVGQFFLLPFDSPQRKSGDFFPSLMLFVTAGLLCSYLSSECLRALRETSAFHQALAQFNEAILLTDPAAETTYVNEPAANLTGWPAAEALMMSIDKLFFLVEEEQRLPLKNPVAKLLGAGKGAIPISTALLLCRDGTERAV